MLMIVKILIYRYIIISLILIIFNFINIRDNNKEDLEYIAVLIFSIFIDFSIFIWGCLELFNKTSNCLELKHSNLWKYGLATFIIQIIMLVFLSIILLNIIYRIIFLQRTAITDIENGRIYGSIE